MPRPRPRRPGRGVWALLLAGLPAAASGLPKACPEGNCRSSIIVWNCAGASNTSYFFLDPHRPSPLLEVPQGTVDLALTGKSDVPVAMLLIDPATRQIVAGDNGGIISSYQPNGTYRGMPITCTGGELGQPLNKNCAVQGPTTAPLLLQLISSGGGDQDEIGTLAFSYRSIQPCPPVPGGCRPCEAVEACQSVLAWSRWVKEKHPDRGKAWTALAEPYAVEPPSEPAEVAAMAPRSVPFFLWEGVWRQWHPTQGDGYLAFHFLDDNHDGAISQREFNLGYDFSGLGSCIVPTPVPLPVANGTQASNETAPGKDRPRGLDAWWSSWIPFAVAAGVLWLLGACAVLICCRRRTKNGHNYIGLLGSKPREEREYGTSKRILVTTSGQADDVSPSKREGRRLCAPCGGGEDDLQEGPHAEIFDRLLSNDTVRRAVEAHPASMRFHHTRLLGYGDRLTDSFRALFDKELLLVDAQSDASLRGFMSFLRSGMHAELPFGSTPHVVAAAKAVVAAFGGSLHYDGHKGEELEGRYQRRFQQLHLEFPRELPLGLLLGRHDGVTGVHEPGAGLQRHRAVLFKYVCDALRVCDSALLWDARKHVVLSLAWAAGKPVAVDLMQEAGSLREAVDLHHLVMQLEGEGGYSPANRRTTGHE